MERFRETIPHVVERIRFVPRMSGPDFLSLLSVADVILDPLHWSGGNTTYEALFFGTPVVTLPSKFMRGRVTGGFYRQMGVMDCVVDTKDKYVKLAVRLGTDPAYREKIKARILAANHVLYENMEVVRDVERFFVEAVETAQRAPKKRRNGES
jgi:predicted O-linked N-acetylglucosamine transferase (SPINDLY family)